MENEDKSVLFKNNFNLIIENKLEQAKDDLLSNYKSHASDIYIMHLLVISHLLLNEKKEIIDLLRYEEEVSLFRTKLGFIRNILTKDNNLNSYIIGKKLLKRGWSSDAEIYFTIHSILSPDHDQSLIPLGERELKKGNFQKGVMLLHKAANNYFKNIKTGA